MNLGESTKRVVAVTGAYGYIGSLLSRRFEAAGWSVRGLVRSPRAGDGQARPYELGRPPADGLLDSVDVLVHCAYDLSLVRRQDVWRTNVEGSRELLRTAARAGVPRIIVLSSMSAFRGTTQLYGQVKLAVEETTMAIGGCPVRPGLVYGDDPGGMAGALRKITKLPLVPVIAGNSRQFPVHEDDLAAAVLALATVDNPPHVPLGVAQPEPVTFRSLLRALAVDDNRRFVPVPWQLPYGLLRLGELLGVKLPFRSDSLRGLIYSAPEVPGRDLLAALGVVPRRLKAPDNR